MELDALAQPERQPGAVLAPRPVGRQFGNDRLETVLLHALLEEDQVVEHAHHRSHGKGRRFLQDGHAGRAVRRIDLQDASGLLGEDGAMGTHARQKQDDRCEYAQVSDHSCLLPEAVAPTW